MSLYIDYDTDRWLFVPNAFPWRDFSDAERWATAVADAFARGSAESSHPPAELLEWLHAYLLGAVRNNTGGAIRYLHLPTLDAPTMIVDVYEGDTDEQTPITMLAGQRATDALRPAEVSSFTSPHLGEGTKSVRMVAQDGGALLRATNWVWRTRGHDIVVLTGTTDLPVGEAMDPVLDDFARSIRLP